VLIAVALFFAMIINLIVAALTGAIIPLILDKLGSDPASSSTVILTTFTDVFGFMSFLGIGSLLLRLVG
jgi:magnesium transporter